MGDAILFWMFVMLVLGINSRSIYVWLRGRSLAGDVAGVSAVLAFVSFLLAFWTDDDLLREIAIMSDIVLTLTSLIACTIARARARARRGSHAWISFLPVPFLATPLLFLGLLLVMETLNHPR